MFPGTLGVGQDVAKRARLGTWGSKEGSRMESRADAMLMTVEASATSPVRGARCLHVRRGSVIGGKPGGAV